MLYPIAISLSFLLVACGGKVVVDASAGEGGGGDAAEGASSSSGGLAFCSGKACGTPCEIAPGQGLTGQCTGNGGCAYEATCPEGPCAGKACGEPCVVCNDIECLDGFCDGAITCQPDPAACPK